MARWQFGIGEMLRMWVKLKNENGRKIMTRTFQSLVAKLRFRWRPGHGVIRGRPGGSAALKTEEWRGNLDRCPDENSLAQLVEGARSCAGFEKLSVNLRPGQPQANLNLLENFTEAEEGGWRVVLDKKR